MRRRGLHEEALGGAYADGEVLLLFLVINLLGFVLAITYNLPSCAQGCNPESVKWPDFLYMGNGLEAPSPYILVFGVLGLWLSQRRGRWGLVGLVLGALYGVLWIAGESSEPFNFWVSHANQYNWGTFLGTSFVLAGGLTLEAVWEIVDRSRHGWRRPA